MASARRKLAGGLLIVCACALLGGGYYLLTQIAPIGAGYKAKILCSAVFVAKRAPESVYREELSSEVNPLLTFVSTAIDVENRSVTAKAFGLVKRKALYREGCGCTIVPAGRENEALWPRQGYLEVEPHDPERVPWPTGDLHATGVLPAEVDAGLLSQALTDAFSEPDSTRLRRTRAVVVVYRGKIIAERYAPGFTKDTPQHGWSMSKSITSALIGILVGQGKLTLAHPAPIQAWRGRDDERARITIDHLLRMSSGLDFHHDLSPVGDRQRQLFGGIDVAANAINRPLSAAPGTQWEYSNANPIILCRIMRAAVGGSDAAYFAFPRRALFNAIGMRSAIIEPDPYGTFIGSSFVWASARDWARFGLLYLQDGVWEGKRILPTGWVAYTRTPAPADQRLHYGALFWLNVGNTRENALKKQAPDEPPYPRLPQDTYFAVGIYDQKIAIIPSRNLVIVRLGLTHTLGAFDTETFIAQVLRAIRA